MPKMDPNEKRKPDEDDTTSKHVLEYYKKFAQNRELDKYFSAGTTSVSYIPEIVPPTENVDEDEAASRASSAMSNRKLEWDNGADIGYEVCSGLQKSASLPSLTDKTHVKSNVKIVVIGDSEENSKTSELTGKTCSSEASVPKVSDSDDKSKSSISTNKSSATSQSSGDEKIAKFVQGLSFLKAKIGLPDAHSTPKVEEPEKLRRKVCSLENLPGFIKERSAKLVGEYKKSSVINLHVTKPVTVECVGKNAKGVCKTVQTSFNQQSKSVQTEVVPSSSLKKNVKNQTVFYVAHSGPSTTDKSTSCSTQSHLESSASFEYLKNYEKREKSSSTTESKPEEPPLKWQRSQRQTDLSKVVNESPPNLDQCLGKIISTSQKHEAEIEKSLELLRKLIKSKRYDAETKKRYLTKIVKKLTQGEFSLEESSTSSELFFPKPVKSKPKPQTTSDSSDDPKPPKQSSLQSNLPWYPAQLPTKNFEIKTFTDEILPKSDEKTSKDSSDIQAEIIPVESRGSNKKYTRFTLTNNEFAVAHDGNGDGSSVVLDSMEKQYDSSKSGSYQNWREEKTMSEKIVEERQTKGQGDCMVQYAKREKQYQINWINSEIAYLRRLKELLEEGQGTSGAGTEEILGELPKNSSESSDGIKKTTTVYTVASNKENSEKPRNYVIETQLGTKNPTKQINLRLGNDKYTVTELTSSPDILEVQSDDATTKLKVCTFCQVCRNTPCTCPSKDYKNYMCLMCRLPACQCKPDPCPNCRRVKCACQKEPSPCPRCSKTLCMCNYRCFWCQQAPCVCHSECRVCGKCPCDCLNMPANINVEFVSKKTRPCSTYPRIKRDYCKHCGASQCNCNCKIISKLRKFCMDAILNGDDCSGSCKRCVNCCTQTSHREHRVSTQTKPKTSDILAQTSGTSVGQAYRDSVPMRSDYAEVSAESNEEGSQTLTGSRVNLDRNVQTSVSKDLRDMSATTDGNVKTSTTASQVVDDGMRMPRVPSVRIASASQVIEIPRQSTASQSTESSGEPSTTAVATQSLEPSQKLSTATGVPSTTTAGSQSVGRVPSTTTAASQAVDPVRTRSTASAVPSVLTTGSQAVDVVRKRSTAGGGPSVVTAGSQAVEDVRKRSTAGGGPSVITAGSQAVDDVRKRSTAGGGPSVTTAGSQAVDQVHKSSAAGVGPLVTTAGAQAVDQVHKSSAAGGFPSVTTAGSQVEDQRQKRSAGEGVPSVTTAGSQVTDPRQYLTVPSGTTSRPDVSQVNPRSKATPTPRSLPVSGNRAQSKTASFKSRQQSEDQLTDGTIKPIMDESKEPSTESFVTTIIPSVPYGETASITTTPSEVYTRKPTDSRVTVPEEETESFTSTTTEDTTEDSLMCACCKQRGGDVSILTSEHSYPLCRVCLNKNAAVTTICCNSTDHICTCYTEINAANVARFNNGKQIYCSCVKPARENNKQCCAYCQCQLQRTAQTNNGIAYTLTLEEAAGLSSSSRKSRRKKRKSLEEIRVKIPLQASSRKKRKDKENTHKRNSKVGNNEDVLSQQANKQTNTLQEYLNHNRPDFIESAEGRRRVLSDSRRSREECKDACKVQFLQDHANRGSNSKERGRLFSANEMREITKKNYKKLPEVQRKLTKAQERRLKEADKLICELFTKKLQCSVLRGKMNFPIDANVISLGCVNSSNK